MQKHQAPLAYLWILLFVFSSACFEDDAPGGTSSAPSPEEISIGGQSSSTSYEGRIKMSPSRCLRRVSLALRHASPSEEDIQAMRNGGNLAEIVDRYLQSPEFEKVVEEWYLREFSPGQNSPDNESADFFREPTRIATRIVLDDMDYRELVTGDFTVTPEGEVVPFTEHDQHAGVLSTRHMLSREVGSFSRNWAGANIYFLTGKVLTAVQVDEEEETDISPSGIKENPRCAGCHYDEIYGVDLMAAFRDGCFDENGFEIPGCTPATSTFLGEEGTGLEGLGKIVAASKEFESQAINFFFRKLSGRSYYQSEEQRYWYAAQAFTTSGYHAKALIKHIVTEEGFCLR